MNNKNAIIPPFLLNELSNIFSDFNKVKSIVDHIAKIEPGFMEKINTLAKERMVQCAADEWPAGAAYKVCFELTAALCVGCYIGMASCSWDHYTHLMASQADTQIVSQYLDFLASRGFDCKQIAAKFAPSISKLPSKTTNNLGLEI